MNEFKGHRQYGGSKVESKHKPAPLAHTAQRRKDGGPMLAPVPGTGGSARAELLAKRDEMRGGK